MTILPKKKHQDRKDDHENESRNRSRNRNRDGRNISSNRSSPDDLSDDGLPNSPQMYDSIDHRDSHQESQCLPMKRVRHNRQTCTNYHHPTGSSLNQKPHRNSKNRNSDISKHLQHQYAEEEEEVDGYNSSDEYDVRRTTSAINDTTEVSAESITEMENNFEHALRERKGFTIKQMATDGACLFRAVADQVYGDQEMHGVVRRHCMDYMMKNRDFFSQYMTEDFNSYIRRKRNEHSHGNHIEMSALSEMYNRPIEVYQYSVDPINTFHSRTAYTNEDTAPIRLSYHGNVHYNSVIDPYNPTVGVGLGLAGYKPGADDKHSLNAVIKESEATLLEQEMLEDKLKATDWEATDEDLAEIAARESYLQWLKDNQKSASTMTSGASSSKCTSTKSRRSPPREAVGSRRSPPRTENNNNNNNSRHASSPRDNSYERSSANLPSSSKNNNSNPNDMGGAAGESSTDMAKMANPWGFSMMTDAEWNDDPVLAAVLAQSQQEYIDHLKANSSKGSKTTDSGCGSKETDS